MESELCKNSISAHSRVTNGGQHGGFQLQHEGQGFMEMFGIVNVEDHFNKKIKNIINALLLLLLSSSASLKLERYYKDIMADSFISLNSSCMALDSGLAVL